MQASDHEVEAEVLVTQDPASGLWHWELVSQDGGAVAKGSTGFRTQQALIDSLIKIHDEAPRSLVFDPTGGLYEGV